MMRIRLFRALALGALVGVAIPAIADSMPSASTSNRTYFRSFGSPVEVAQPDGRRLIGGTLVRESTNETNYSFAVERFNRDGTPDTGFNGSGLVEAPIWGYYEFVNALVVQPDGKIIVGGTAAEPRSREAVDTCYPAFCNYYPALVRLNRDGTLDRSFNGTGRLVLSIGAPHRGEDCCGGVGSLELQSDGRVLIEAEPNTIARINADGTLDRSFATAAQEVDVTRLSFLEIDAGFTGSWYNPAQNGHGFALEVLSGPPTQLLASWFTFAPEGGQSWVVGLGRIDGNGAVVNAYQSTGPGGRFPPNFDSTGVHQRLWGTLSFTFTDCNHGYVEWVSSIPGYGSGRMDLTRLTLPAGVACSKSG